VRTQVGIVGAGPAGLFLSHLLARHGIESVVLEARSRDYVEKRVRAGVLEHGTVELLTQTGVGERLHRDGLVHHGLELRYGGRGHRIALSELAGGRTITVYGQQEVVKDLIQARLDAGGEIRFEVSDVEVAGFARVDGQPRVRFRAGGAEHELACDVIAGCDGFHGICRPAIPAGVLTEYERVYPYAWLGILAATPPSATELIYSYHERGFALHSMRSPSVTRLYLQVPPAEELADWPDDRVWAELRTRLSTEDGFELADGPVLEKGITPLRSYVVEPMQYGRLFLAGDAAHIVPATGAKGLNLAVADVCVLAAALDEFYRSGRTDLLAAYSQTCLRRVWRVQHFSWWMTSMLHRAGDGFTDRLQLSQLDYVTSSRAAATTLAENYVGLPLPGV
jgi:p-hydroxybenzoate 3-monooxygenase